MRSGPCESRRQVRVTNRPLRPYWREDESGAIDGTCEFTEPLPPNLERAAPHLEYDRGARRAPVDPTDRGGVRGRVGRNHRLPRSSTVVLTVVVVPTPIKRVTIRRRTTSTSFGKGYGWCQRHSPSRSFPLRTLTWSQGGGAVQRPRKDAWSTRKYLGLAFPDRSNRVKETLKRDAHWDCSGESDSTTAFAGLVGHAPPFRMDCPKVPGFTSGMAKRRYASGRARPSRASSDRETRRGTSRRRRSRSRRERSGT